MHVVVETFLNKGEPSTAKRRVRALEGQGIAPNIRVQCSRGMREEFRLGQRFLLEVNWLNRETSDAFLSANYRDKPQPLSDEEALRYIADNFTKHR